jgi:hypothetical protein
MLIKFNVSAKCDKSDLLIVELWLPVNDWNNENDSAVTSKDANKKFNPSFQRSISGKREHTSIECKHLPQLRLSVTLPPLYPTEESPHFKISSNWLQKSQLTKLCQKLDEIWKNNLNMPVLYTWLEWLENNLIEYLDILEEPNKIVLTKCFNQNDNSEEEDERAFSSFIDDNDLIFQFLRFNLLLLSLLFKFYQ